MPEVSVLYTPPFFLRSPQEVPGPRTITQNLNQQIVLPTDRPAYVSVESAIIPYTFQTVFNGTETVDNPQNNLFTIDFVGSIGLQALAFDPGAYYSPLFFNNALESIMQTNGWFIVDAFGNNLYPINIDANLTLQRLVISFNLANGAPVGTTSIVFDLNPGAVAATTVGTGPGQLLGFVPFPDNTQPSVGLPLNVPPPVPLDTTVALQFVGPFESQIANQFASGIYVIAEGDIQPQSVLGDNTESRVICQILMTSQSVPFDVLMYPINGQKIIHVPLNQSRIIKQVKIKFVRSDDPTKDLFFLSGNASIILLFRADNPLTGTIM